MRTRRHFLQWLGVGTAASLATGREFAAAVPTRASTAVQATFELALASYSFHRFPLDQAIGMTKRVGLKHFCMHPLLLPLTATPTQIAQATAKVRAAGLDLYGGGVIYMAKPADVDRAFAYAKSAGLRIIVGVPLPELLSLVNQNVQKHDIRVAIHNHGPGDNVYPTPDVVYERVKGLDGRIGLCMDIGHTVRAGRDPSRDAEQFADRLLEIHIKDVSVAAPNGACVEMGRGIINVPDFLRTLLRNRFAGKVAFEYEKDPDAPLVGLAESVGYVRGALAAFETALIKS